MNLAAESMSDLGAEVERRLEACEDKSYSINKRGDGEILVPLKGWRQFSKYRIIVPGQWQA